MTIQVVKRDGSREALDLEKFHVVTAFACEGLTGVSASEIELRTHLQFYDGIKTSDVMESQIRAAADLISEDSPNYQYAAGRLINYHLRKLVWKGNEPPVLWDHYHEVELTGFYTNDLIVFDEKEWESLQGHIDHDRDFLFTHAAMELWRNKYLIRNRVTNEYMETPQFAMMLIAMCLFKDYPRDTRLKWIKDYYDAISTFDISLPTPVMAGVRTPQKQFSSCVLIETEDSLDSMCASSHAIMKYVSNRAGIGIGAGRIRAINSPVRGGSISHTGVVPFYKFFQGSLKACNQGSVRVASGTLYYPIWHLEVEDMLVLKNNKGTEESRVRNLDYGVQLNRLMYERLLHGGKITLFSPHDVPEMYDAFFADQDRFKELYEKAEKNPHIRKKSVSAMELFSLLLQERKDTGRIYIMNVDHCNSHGSFLPDRAPIRMSNLCAEVTLPTKPMDFPFVWVGDEWLSVEDTDKGAGEIALCILSAINWGKIKEPGDFKRPCELAVRGLDALIDYQTYLFPQAEWSAKRRRPIGVGIINMAYWMAKNDMTYSEPDLGKVHEFAEAYSYYLIRASVDLATWKEPCWLCEETKYENGILPIDTYKKTLDEIAPFPLKQDWEGLRKDLLNEGIRNSTLMAIMPAETSAIISNSTNGIEPPRALVSVKQSKDGVTKQVVPEVKRLKNKYELLWDQKSPEGYLKVCAVLQKFVDQSISTNTTYNPKHYGGKVPMSELLGHLVWWYKMGGKTLYYCNTFDGAGELDHSDDGCESCKI